MKINYLIPLFVFLMACASIDTSQHKMVQDAKERRGRFKDPQIRTIIHNDYMLGFLYNKGKKFSDKEFMYYVLDIIQEDERAVFFTGFNIHRKKVIKYAVIYYGDTN